MNDVGYASGLLKASTGQDHELGVLERFMNNRVNRRTVSDGSVRAALEGFSYRQRAWYELMLGDILPRFGYSLYE